MKNAEEIMTKIKKLDQLAYECSLRADDLMLSAKESAKRGDSAQAIGYCERANEYRTRAESYMGQIEILTWVIE